MVSALIAVRASQQARQADTVQNAATRITRWQAFSALIAARFSDWMLRQQGLAPKILGRLNPPAWTTAPDVVEEMIKATDSETEFDRLVASIVQEAARAAQEALVTVRAETGWVRQLTLPSCSRCAILAGRVYMYSDGFLRHPNCDCVMVPVAENDWSQVVDPVEWAKQGKITGLSKADREALDEGADLAQLVNVRRKSAGLTEAGTVLVREGRPTPAGIYRIASNRDEAVRLLKANGYLL